MSALQLSQNQLQGLYLQYQGANFRGSFPQYLQSLGYSVPNGDEEPQSSSNRLVGVNVKERIVVSGEPRVSGKQLVGVEVPKKGSGDAGIFDLKSRPSASDYQRVLGKGFNLGSTVMDVGKQVQSEGRASYESQQKQKAQQSQEVLGVQVQEPQTGLGGIYNVSSTAQKVQRENRRVYEESKPKTVEKKVAVNKPVVGLIPEPVKAPTTKKTIFVGGVKREINVGGKPKEGDFVPKLPLVVLQESMIKGMGESGGSVTDLLRQGRDFVVGLHEESQGRRVERFASAAGMPKSSVPKQLANFVAPETPHETVGKISLDTGVGFVKGAESLINPNVRSYSGALLRSGINLVTGKDFVSPIGAYAGDIQGREGELIGELAFDFFAGKAIGKGVQKVGGAVKSKLVGSKLDSYLIEHSGRYKNWAIKQIKPQTVSSPVFDVGKKSYTWSPNRQKAIDLAWEFELTPKTSGITAPALLETTHKTRVLPHLISRGGQVSVGYLKDYGFSRADDGLLSAPTQTGIQVTTQKGKVAPYIPRVVTDVAKSGLSGFVGSAVVSGARGFRGLQQSDLVVEPKPTVESERKLSYVPPVSPYPVEEDTERQLTRVIPTKITPQTFSTETLTEQKLGYYPVRAIPNLPQFTFTPQKQPTKTEPISVPKFTPIDVPKPKPVVDLPQAVTPEPYQIPKVTPKTFPVPEVVQKTVPESIVKQSSIQNFDVPKVTSSKSVGFKIPKWDINIKSRRRSKRVGLRGDWFVRKRPVKTPKQIARELAGKKRRRVRR